MRISDWSSDVCSSDLEHDRGHALGRAGEDAVAAGQVLVELRVVDVARRGVELARAGNAVDREAAQRFLLLVPGVEVPVVAVVGDALRRHRAPGRSEEHTSELQSLMRNSYAVFGLKQKQTSTQQTSNTSSSSHPQLS